MRWRRVLARWFLVGLCVDLTSGIVALATTPQAGLVTGTLLGMALLGTRGCLFLLRRLRH